MFLPVFSSSESFCMDPLTAAGLAITAIATATGNITVAVIDNTSAAISRTVEFWAPTEADIATAKAAKVNSIEFDQRLNYNDKQEKYRNCLTKSKPESVITEHGVPVGCQDLMMAFVLCGGNAKASAAEMTATFNEFKKR